MEKLDKKSLGRNTVNTGEKLKSLFNMPKSTLCCGFFNEFGFWTMKCQVKYRKMILFPNSLNADDKQLMRKSQRSRQDIENGWYREVLREDKKRNWM